MPLDVERLTGELVRLQSRAADLIVGEPFPPAPQTARVLRELQRQMAAVERRLRRLELRDGG